VSGTAYYICPRCGKPLVRIDYKRKGSKVYAYGLHREVLPDGKVRWYYHYLGPADNYEHVAKLQADLGLQLKGLIQEVVEGKPLIIDYLEGIAKAIEDKMAKGQMSAYTAQQLADRCQGLLDRLRKYAEERAEAEAEARKAAST